MIRFVCWLAIVAGLASSALGDIPPPPPEAGFKRVPYENVLKLEAELSGYRFYPFQRLGLGGQETIGEELQLGTKEGVPVPSSSSPSVRTGVVAVPEKVLEELGTKENLAKLLSRGNQEKLPAGVVVYETGGTSRDLRESDSRTKVQNVITISRDEAAGVKFTAQETPEPPASAAGSSTGPPTMLIGGIAAALAIAALGIWYFRRK